MNRTLMVCLAVLLAWSADAEAGKYNPIMNVGDAAPEWKDLPGVDGDSHSLSKIKDAKVVVVAFTCNSCPYAVDAEDRLVQLTKDYRDQGMVLVAINVNLIEEDRLPAMKEKAKAKGFEFAYLFDETQQIARDFGAKYTPEFFVLDGDRRVVYMGAMDDSPDGKSVAKNYVRDAIDAVLSGTSPTVQETVPIGCRIRVKRQRRTR